MSQGQIIELLEKHKQTKFILKEIADALNLTRTNTSDNLRRLRKFDMINYKKVKKKNYQSIYVYWHKED